MDSNVSMLLALVVSAITAAAGNQCPSFIEPCGFGCLVAPASTCRDNQCYDNKGARMLCSPASHTCGDDICPLFTWCANGRCVANTCQHRHEVWCRDPGSLHETACSKLQANSTKCYESTSASFSCYISQGLLVAKCSKRVAVGLAAAKLHISDWEQQKQQQVHHTRPQSVESSSKGHSSTLLQRIQQGLSSMLYHRSRSLLQIPFSPGDAGLSWTNAGGKSQLFRLFGSSDSSDYEYIGQPSSQALLSQQARMFGSSYGGPVPVSRFTPAMANPRGSIIQPSNGAASPGCLFIKTGSGGAIAGSYGGGWSGPYSTSTRGYLPGGSYGWSRPYYGDAVGSAVVFMPSAHAPNSPQITYPCPVGAPVGTFISVGIPCGIPLTSVPAAQLGTVGGLPAGVDLQKTGLLTPTVAAPPTVYTPVPVTPSYTTPVTNPETTRIPPPAPTPVAPSIPPAVTNPVLTPPNIRPAQPDPQGSLPDTPPVIPTEPIDPVPTQQPSPSSSLSPAPSPSQSPTPSSSPSPTPSPSPSPTPSSPLPSPSPMPL